MVKKNKKIKIKKIAPLFLIGSIGITSLVVLLIIIFNLDKQKNILNMNNTRISKIEYSQELNKVMKFYSWSKQNIHDTETIKKDVLDRLIEQKIIDAFAKQNNIKVNENELYQRYKSVLGTKTEKQYLEIIYSMYGMSRKEFLQNLSYEITKEKIQAFVNKPFHIWLQEMKKMQK